MIVVALFTLNPRRHPPPARSSSRSTWRPATSWRSRSSEGPTPSACRQTPDASAGEVAVGAAEHVDHHRPHWSANSVALVIVRERHLQVPFMPVVSADPPPSITNSNASTRPVPVPITVADPAAAVAAEPGRGSCGPTKHFARSDKFDAFAAAPDAHRSPPPQSRRRYRYRATRPAKPEMTDAGVPTSRGPAGQRESTPAARRHRHRHRTGGVRRQLHRRPRRRNHEIDVAHAVTCGSTVTLVPRIRSAPHRRGWSPRNPTTHGDRRQPRRLRRVSDRVTTATPGWHRPRHPNSTSPSTGSAPARGSRTQRRCEHPAWVGEVDPGVERTADRDGQLVTVALHRWIAHRSGRARREPSIIGSCR